jgi:hypothetical protein
MPQQVALLEIERKVRAAAFQDGLMEIMIGVYMLVMGIILNTSASMIPISLLVVLFFIPLYERLKQRVMYPRIGYVKLPTDSEADVKGILLTTFGSLALLIALIPLLRWWLGADQGWDLWFQHLVPAAIGILIAFGPLWMSQTYAVRRGYFFAALSVILGIAIPFMGDFTGYEAVGLECLLLGSLFLIVGGFLFARFVAQQPIEGAPHAES